jgi:hypothetical protein
VVIPGFARRGASGQDPRRVGSAITYALGCLLTGAAAGVPAGWLWTHLASPANGTVTSSGVVLGETALNQEVGVTMWFLTTGVAVGLLVGVGFAWRSSRYGVTAVVAVVIACGLGSLVSYWTGVHLFGPDAKTELASARVGQHIALPVSVGTKIAFLGWPVGGLLGVLVAISRWPRTSHRLWVTRSSGGAHRFSGSASSDVTTFDPAK